MTDDLGYRVKPHVVTSSFDEGEEGVLIDLETRRYHQLNETAMIIMGALVDQTSKAALISQLVTRYAVSEQGVEASIERTLREMEAAGFISPAP